MATNRHPFTPEEEAQIEAEYEKLISAYLASNHRKKVDIIRRAFELARSAHGEVRRRSGEPYILHPIAVAQIICGEMGMGSTSICSALLHDVIEDTEYTVEDIRAIFGNSIAQIVDGVTKISNDNLGTIESLQAENYRKLLLTMSDDARVIVIKIADRLHNMRTLGSMPAAKQYKIAGETLFIYAPLAHRFGLYGIKTELENLSFKYEHPEQYAEICRLVAVGERERALFFDKFSAPIRTKLDKLNIRYEIQSRVKSPYSIWHKMQEKGVPFSQVFDLFAVRIVFDNLDDSSEKLRCLEIYNLVAEIYLENDDRFRNWLNKPKSNGYQAVHTTVMGPEGRWVEVQIRSRRMDEVAEQGLAAHWRYKTGQVEEDTELKRWLDNIREILQNPSPRAMDILDSIKLSLYANDITVFTPRGDSFRLPLGATVLDMAFALHSELGSKCIGAKVDNNVVPLSTELHNGSIVEVLATRSIQVKPEWRVIAVTAKARMGIDAALRQQQRELSLRGEAMLMERLGDLGIEATTPNIDRLLHFFRFNRREDFYRAIAVGEANINVDMHKALRSESSVTQNVLDYVLNPFRSGRKKAPEVMPEPIYPDEPHNPIDRKQVYTLEETDGKLSYTRAACCRPLPGDDVLGVVEDDERVTVHKRTCPVAARVKSTHGDRLLSTLWGNHGAHLFDETIIFRGIDSVGILHEISGMLLNENRISITSINISTKDGVFDGELSILVHSLDELNRLIQTLAQKGLVLSISRKASPVS